jgi:3-deoxy-D-manno-octulosonic-acid transferase
VVRPLVEGLYAGAGQLARALAALIPESESKLSRTLHARRGIRYRYTEWARRHRNGSEPLVWMHAPSVGEGLQARPVLEIIRRERPDVLLAYTHFSPSAESFAAKLDVDFHDYLAFDTTVDAAVALEALRPSALVFSKLDVWPLLARRAARDGVALGLISGTVAPGSARLRMPVRWLMRPAYERLNLAGAVSDDHAERLVQLGVRRDRVRVTGDTRYDQVWARAQSVDAGSALLAPLQSSRPTFVAGSTWPSDEQVLLPAWLAARERVTDARLIMAPHEPSASHLAALESALLGTGLRYARLGAAQNDTDVVIVDRVGVLGELYSLADAAFVGGGFHAAGLHSVLEPAAFGVPVAFGPRFHNSRDAVRLSADGGGVATASAAELSTRLIEWLGNASAREGAGARALQVVRQELGAAERSAALVLELLDRPPR